MKVKLLIFFLCFFEFVSFAFSQTKEAEKITEFGLLPCGHLMAQVDGSFQYFQREKNENFYIVYYEGKKRETSVFNIKTQKYDKFTQPIRGYALNRAKEIVLYLNTVYKPKKEQVTLINGGFREDFSLELWMSSKGAMPPKITPTLSEKDIKFRKGKLSQIRDCSKAYDNY